MFHLYCNGHSEIENRELVGANPVNLNRLVSSSGSLAPPPQAIQRNNSRTTTTNTTKTTNETNLMSFSDDTLLLATDSVSLTSPINDPHTEFMQKIDKMHRYLY